MNFKKITTLGAALFVALCLTGCGKNSTNENTDNFQKQIFGDADTSQSSGSSQSSGKQKVPDEKELNELVKKQIWKDFVSDSPFEIADVTVNWVEKTAQSCSGDFSVNLRAKENLYEQVNVKEGLEKLGIKNLYEGELNQASEKAYKLPEPYKTNLRNEYPQDRLDHFQFVNVLRSKGSPDKAGGVVEMNRYGDEWSTSVRFKTSPSVERCFPESGLNNSVQKLDDPETKKAVESILQKRKDYVNKIDATINDLQKKHEAALTDQKETVLQYFKPNLRYDGTWNNGDLTGKCSIIFGNYETNQTIITGKFFDPAVPNATVPITLTFDLNKIQNFPVTGIVNEKHPDFPKGYTRYASESFATISHERFLRHVYNIKMRVNQSGELVGESSGYEFNLGKPR